jgi:hypothetical protein
MESHQSRKRVNGGIGENIKGKVQYVGGKGCNKGLRD